MAMRYQPREYQSDSSSLPLGRSDDRVKTKGPPSCESGPENRTNALNYRLIDTGLSISEREPNLQLRVSQRLCACGCAEPRVARLQPVRIERAVRQGARVRDRLVR